MSILRVPPGTLRSFVFLDTDSPLFNPYPSIGLGVDQKISVTFVMENRLQSRLIERRIGDVVLVEVKIMMEKQANFP
ncbi:MAG: hypothetical protein Q6358_07165 [Candidatus Brocadiales bacterium]|nr:hypothetical protein [Candidatus Brocadiales bacterium]